MPEYLSPGVYIEEVPSGAVPIQGVSTATAGFVGCSERGSLRPTLVMSWLDFQRKYGGLPSGEEVYKLGYLAHAVQGFFENGGQRAYIARVLDADSAKTLAKLEIPAKGKTKLTVAAAGPGNAGGNTLVKISEGSLRNAKHERTRDLFRLSVIYYRGETDAPTRGLEKLPDPDLAESVASKDYREPTLHESFDNLSLDPKAPNFVEAVVNQASNLIRIAKTGAAPLDDILDAMQSYRALSIEKPVAPKIPKSEDYEGSDNGSRDPDDWTGLKGLGAIQEVSILCIPDQGLDALHKPLLLAMQAHCETARDRFAIAQFPAKPGPVAGMRSPIGSSYVALYYPWLTVQDPQTMALAAVPPAGHIAGVYARTDIERGVHKAPADQLVLGPILQDIGTAGPLAASVTRGDQDVLNPRNINVIRDFREEGRGLRVWGARTTSSDHQWRYISVRRLFIFVEQSLEQGTQWVVFEPNDQSTWERVAASVSGFLNTIWRSGALAGAAPEEAYFVRCDRTTMTQDDIDNGRLICEIGIAPVKPAEFVIFRIGHRTGA